MHGRALLSGNKLSVSCWLMNNHNNNNITIIEFMFAGINMFWARFRLILARAEEYFFHQRCEKMSANFEMASRF